jgi:hypothetical protein
MMLPAPSPEAIEFRGAVAGVGGTHAGGVDLVGACRAVGREWASQGAAQLQRARHAGGVGEAAENGRVAVAASARARSARRPSRARRAGSRPSSHPGRPAAGRDSRARNWSGTRLVLDFAFHVLQLRNVLLETLEWNVAGLTAYERVGFRRVGVRRGAVMSRGRPTDLVIMDAVPRDFGASVLR